MNESLGGSYQWCHMLAVLLLQQHRPSGGVGAGVEKNSSDVSGRCRAQAQPLAR